MTRSFTRLACGGLLAAALGIGSAFAAEPTPSPRPSGVIGDVDEQALQQKKEAADATIKKNPEPVSKEAIKQQDKAKAVQTGNDATLRDLPSPAEKGSE